MSCFQQGICIGLVIGALLAIWVIVCVMAKREYKYKIDNLYVKNDGKEGTD